jgi:hypothetical protein
MITDLKDLLNNIGYDRLTDNGAYWRTNAIYRNGDNKTSLRIHKRTGSFQDFVDKRYGTIEDLIKLTFGIGDVELKSFYEGNSLNIHAIVEKDDIPKLTMEKTWTEAELTNLLPHYKFYEERGISKDTLRFFKSGFAHSGSMNERYVFPIYSPDGKIHGWSGRDMTGKKEAKWKHIGKKSSWIYPAYVPLYKKLTENQTMIVFPVLEEIKRTREVILVESIGDMLSLWEKGQRNVLVTFGLVMSSKLGSFIMSLDIDKVVIALNNDIESDINRGKEAAIAMFIDLMHYMDLSKLKIALPHTCNDFGVMNNEQYVSWKEYKDADRQAKTLNEILHELRNRFKNNSITNAEMKFGYAVKNEYEQITS